MAGAVLVIVPILVVFAALQRYIIAGLTQAASQADPARRRSSTPQLLPTKQDLPRQLPKGTTMATNLDRQAFPGAGRRGGRRRGTGRLRRARHRRAPAPRREAADIDFSGVKPAATIDFWTNHPGKSQDVEKAIIEKFHAKYPDIKVNLVTAGANYEEIAQKFQTVAGRQVGPARTLWCSPTSGGSATSPTGASSLSTG